MLHLLGSITELFLGCIKIVFTFFLFLFALTWLFGQVIVEVDISVCVTCLIINL